MCRGSEVSFCFSGNAFHFAHEAALSPSEKKKDKDMKGVAGDSKGPWSNAHVKGILWLKTASLCLCAE